MKGGSAYNLTLLFRQFYNFTNMPNAFKGNDMWEEMETIFVILLGWAIKYKHSQKDWQNHHSLDTESCVKTCWSCEQTWCMLVVSCMQSAHLALIDTLMMAYTVETVSMEKVVACMQQYSTDCADGDTPYDTEDGVISWMNKVVWLFIISFFPSYWHVNAPLVWFIRKNTFGYLVCSVSGH